MKSEEEIREFVNGMKDGSWLWKSSLYWRENPEIPIGVAVWFVCTLIRKKVLGDIPTGVYSFYCPTHKRAYLEETGNIMGSGCEKCPSNNIWQNKGQ